VCEDSALMLRPHVADAVIEASMTTCQLVAYLFLIKLTPLVTTHSRVCGAAVAGPSGAPSAAGAAHDGVAPGHGALP